MNLGEEMALVRERLSEPHRTDETNAFVRDLEIVRWIAQGELQCLRDLVDDALYTVQKEATVSLTAGVGPLPADFMRLVTVQVQLKAGGIFVEADLVSPKQNRNLTQSPQWRPSAMRPFCYIFQNKLYVFPVTANAVNLRYVYRPDRRYKLYTGVHNGASSLVTFSSTAMEQLTADFWLNSEMTINNGVRQGESRTCTGSTGAAPPILTVNSFSAQVIQGTNFTIGEVSKLPAELYPLWIAWAAALGFQKDREAQNAENEKEIYATAVKTINERYQGLNRAEPVKEMPR